MHARFGYESLRPQNTMECLFDMGDHTVLVGSGCTIRPDCQVSAAGERDWWPLSDTGRGSINSGILPTGTTTLSQWFIRGAPRLCNMWSPLHWAAHCGDPEVMQALIDCKADIDSRTDIDRTPLHETGVQNTGANGLTVVRFMLEHSVNTNARMQGTTPLHLSSNYGRSDVALLLIEHGAQIEVKDSRWWVTLQLA